MTGVFDPISWPALAACEAVVCPRCGTRSAAADWNETEVYCETCGGAHLSVAVCPKCGDTFDPHHDAASLIAAQVHGTLHQS